MNEDALKRLIQTTILCEFARQGMYYFPVAISARHIHLSREHFEQLFGQEKKMTRFKNLSQPGQFACEETVEISGPKASIKKVRVLGPERNETQVEISVSDSFSLGIRPEIRMSGDIAGTPGCTITGPIGKITIDRGVIAAARHIHLSAEQAALYGVKDGEAVAVKTSLPRKGVIDNIAVRVGKDFDMEIHLDTDEANGNGILCGTILEVCDRKENTVSAALDLVTENDVNRAFASGAKIIYYTAKGFASPAAKDRAREKGIMLCKLHG